MARSDQKASLAPPQANDASLKDFAAVIQRNFEDLFSRTQEQVFVTAVPDASQGNVGDLYFYESSGVCYLYVKFVAGWKRFVPA